MADSAGKPIIHLETQADFVFQANLHSQIVYFHEDSAGPPASIVILIDASGSMKAKLPDVENALIALVDTLNPCDEVAALSFNSEKGVRVLTPFTTDRVDIEASLGVITPYRRLRFTMQSVEVLRRWRSRTIRIGS